MTLGQRFLRAVLRQRKKVLTKSRDNRLELLERYAGVGDNDVVQRWRNELVEIKARLDDVTTRLHRLQG